MAKNCRNHRQIDRNHPTEQWTIQLEVFENHITTVIGIFNDKLSSISGSNHCLKLVSRDRNTNGK